LPRHVRPQTGAVGRLVHPAETRPRPCGRAFSFALAFRNCAPRTLDVRARTRVPAIDEQSPRPDVDGEFVLSGEVIVETAEQQFFQTRFPIAFGFLS
jgi:hypothetical protein